MSDTCRLARIHTFIHIHTDFDMQTCIYIYTASTCNYNSTCTCVYTCKNMHIVHIHIQVIPNGTLLYWSLLALFFFRMQQMVVFLPRPTRAPRIHERVSLELCSMPWIAVLRVTWLPRKWSLLQWKLATWLVTSLVVFSETGIPKNDHRMP